MLEFLQSHGLQSVAGALGLALSLVGGLAWFSQRRKKLIAMAAYYAFHITEDVGNEIDGEDGFDKAAHALKVIDEVLVAKGWRPLKPGEVAGAKLELSANHGIEVAKTKVAEAAAVAGVEAAAAAHPSLP